MSSSQKPSLSLDLYNRNNFKTSSESVSFPSAQGMLTLPNGVTWGDGTYQNSTSGFGAPLTVEEVDGTPSVSNVNTIKVTNGTLTDDGSGVVTITTGGGVQNPMTSDLDAGGFSISNADTFSGLFGTFGEVTTETVNDSAEVIYRNKGAVAAGNYYYVGELPVMTDAEASCIVVSRCLDAGFRQTIVIHVSMFNAKAHINLISNAIESDTPVFTLCSAGDDGLGSGGFLFYCNHPSATWEYRVYRQQDDKGTGTYPASSFFNFAPGGAVSTTAWVTVYAEIDTSVHASAAVSESFLAKTSLTSATLQTGTAVATASLSTALVNTDGITAKTANAIIPIGTPSGPLYVDTQNNRIGIGVPNPTEDLEIDGNIQMDTGSTSKIVFYDKTNDHEHGEIDAEGELTDGGVIKFQTKVDGGSVTEKLRINNAGAIGIGGAVYGGTNQAIVSRGSNVPPTWKNNYPNVVSGFPVPPSSNLYGDQILFNFTGSGNIGAYMPMIWNGVTWKVIGSTTLCRWYSGTASQVINSTTITNITIGDYGSRTFTPPITGYYEIGQNWFRWELNSGIGMSTYFSATDGSEHYRLYYTEDWNGPYQHWRAGVSSPFVALLQSTKTYRFTANISYAFGNQGTLVASGSTAYVKALSS